MPAAHPPPGATKSELRRWARSLPPVTPTESTEVREGLARWLARRGCSTVLVYLAMPGEVDLEPLTTQLRRLRWATTRTPEQGWLTVHPIDAPRERHRYGFEQPIEGADRVDPAEVHIVFAPGVLFDPRGGRLGHGAGYYDELLKRVRSDAELVGVTVERRVVPAVPMEDDDVRMGWLATERGVRPAGSPSDQGGDQR